MPEVTITHKFKEDEIDDLHYFLKRLEHDPLRSIDHVKMLIRACRKDHTMTADEAIRAIQEELADYE